MSKYKYKLVGDKWELKETPTTIKEKVINGKKVYNTNEINKWVKYGLDMGYIDKENTEIVNWIKILKDKVIDL
jgi:hypothetical protein